MKRFFLVAGFLALAALDLQANNGSTDIINNYVVTVSSLIGDKIQIIAITIVMIFSGILAWKNASVAPLGWGAAASMAIGASANIASNLKGLVLTS